MNRLVLAASGAAFGLTTGVSLMSVLAYAAALFN